jgi:hypothetical protein
MYSGGTLGQFYTIYFRGLVLPTYVLLGLLMIAQHPLDLLG